MTDIFQHDRHTIGEFIRAVVVIDTPEDAKEFFEAAVVWRGNRPLSPGNTPVSAVQDDIGWCFGEGMYPERIKMWSEVCQASHPVFGLITPIVREALEADRKLAEEDH